MRTNLTIALILLMNSCISNNIGCELKGVWCNQVNHCIYFGESMCITNGKEVRKYKPLENGTIVVGKGANSITYQMDFENNKIRIEDEEINSFKNYEKKNTKFNYSIEGIYFSSSLDFIDLDLYLDKNSNLQIRINFHPTIEPGLYTSKLDETLGAFILEMINGIDIDIEPILKKEVFSDIQEWCLMVQSDKDYLIYHNYQDVNRDHENLAFLLASLPFLTELKITDKTIDLDVIKNYGKSEFDRNTSEVYRE